MTGSNTTNPPARLHRVLDSNEPDTIRCPILWVVALQVQTPDPAAADPVQIGKPRAVAFVIDGLGMDLQSDRESVVNIVEHGQRGRVVERSHDETSLVTLRQLDGVPVYGVNP